MLILSLILAIYELSILCHLLKHSDRDGWDVTLIVISALMAFVFGLIFALELLNKMGYPLVVF